MTEDLLMIRRFLAFAIIISLCSCAKPNVPTPTASQATPTFPTKGWWHVRFKIFWPQDSRPRWWVDAAIAHEVINPILRNNKSNIELWRFHRRAARDKTGHQLSLLFYSSAMVADRVYEDIAANTFLQELLTEGIVVSVKYDDTSLVAMAGIGDTSDPNWAVEIQNSWPYFIMGASEMWLGTLNQITLEYQKEHPFSSLDEKLEGYQDIYDSMVFLWQEQCGHALLHHLYALYGYVPIKVRQVDMLMRF
ncbi:MAG: hypothetical protein DRH15_02755 [Deltaproteobacteria bacterium]|nr:MAG: hypothetical protein DRH15_02755 [Deltaproteobacteria bacterium]